MAYRAFAPLIRLQAVTAIGIQLWYRQHHRGVAGLGGQTGCQRQRGRQHISTLGIHQHTVLKTHMQTRRFQAALCQCIQFKSGLKHAPGMHHGHLRNAFIGPGLPGSLLLKLLRRHQDPASPQRAFNFHRVAVYALAFGIWETNDRLTSIPSTWKCGTAYSLTRKKPGLSSISSTVTLASRRGWDACKSSPGSVISVTSPRTQLFSSSSSRRRSLVVPMFSRWISFR